MEGSLGLVLIFLITAVTLVPLAKRWGLGAVLGYLIGGLLLGPLGLKLFSDTSSLLHFSELGVVILLFLIGLELKPQRLWAMRKSLLGLGGGQVLLTTGLLTAAGISLGLDLRTSVLVGIGLSLSSTAFAVQIMAEKNELNTAYGRSSFAILLFQDMAAIPVLAIIPLLAAENFNISQGLGWGVGKVVITIAGLILVGRPLTEKLLRSVANARSRELFTSASLLIVLGVAALMQQLGLSAALGSFLAGLLLSDSEYRHQIEAEMESFKGLLLGLFFMAVGMSLDIEIIKEQYPALLFALLILFFSKTAVIYALGRFTGHSNAASQNMAVVLSQGGEFAFVLFGAAASVQVLEKQTSDFLIVLVTLSMVLTALAKIVNDRWILPLMTRQKKDFDQLENTQNQILIAGFGRVGQVPARLLRVLGIDFTAFELDAEQVQVIRRFGNKVFYGDASRLDLLESAGARDAKIFILAIDDVESSLKTAEVVRTHFPHLRIFARARNRAHVFKLMDLGITDIWRETFSSSLEMSGEVLSALGYSAEQVQSITQTFREGDEKLLREQFHIRDNEKEMINQSKQATVQISELLRTDLSKDNELLQRRPDGHQQKETH